ncbi:MAG: glycosyl hydrolase 53 family protein [Agathobacter sp.]|nr:glycosyl hydrolase 53 family protein [Agathobacter sp.]
MKKGLKRLLSGLLAVVMVLSLVLVAPTAGKNLVKAGEDSTFTLYYYYEGEDVTIYMDIWNHAGIEFAESATTDSSWGWNHSQGVLQAVEGNDNWYAIDVEIVDATVSDGFDLYVNDSSTKVVTYDDQWNNTTDYATLVGGTSDSYAVKDFTVYTDVTEAGLVFESNEESTTMTLYYYYEGEDVTIYMDIWNHAGIEFAETATTDSSWGWNHSQGVLQAVEGNDNWYSIDVEIVDATVSDGFDLYVNDSSTKVVTYDDQWNNTTDYATLVGGTSESYAIKENTVYTDISEAGIVNKVESTTFQLYYYAGDADVENIYLNIWNHAGITYGENAVTEAAFGWSNQQAVLQAVDGNDGWYVTELKILDATVSDGFDLYLNDSESKLASYDDQWNNTTDYGTLISQESEAYAIKNYTVYADISAAGIEIVEAEYSYEDLQALIATAPADYETAGFTSDSAAALKTALAAATACTESTSATELDSAYVALKDALAALVYEDDVLTIEKVNGITDDFIKGVDISSYITEVNSGVVYKDWNGNAVDGVGFIKLFADTGVNYIRLRVWNQPYEVDENGNPAKDENGNVKYYGGGNNDLEVTKEICEMIAKYNEQYDGNVKVLIDLQYSDFWADPEKQTAPKAWADITDIDELTEKVREFTIATLEDIAETGVEIGMVQVGNETNTGICGRSEGSDDYYEVFKAGCDAVKEFDENVLRVVHFTDPQSASKADHFAGSLYNKDVDYDVYATSYYPFWHGTTDNLYQVLKSISTKYGKMVMVAETQYPYTNDDYDGSDNQAYEGKDNIDLSKWPVSLQGQANEIRDVINAVARVGEKGIGMFYWEPAWLGVGNAYDEDGNLDEEAYKANQEKWNTYGSGWASEYAAEYDMSAAKWGYGGTNNENASLFDFTGNPNATLNVFKYVNYGSVSSSKSFYSMDGVDGATVLVGATADEILAELPTEADFLYNDKTSGTAKITWSTDSLNEVAEKVSTTNAIGNTYLVSGTITVDGEAHTVNAEISVEPAENLVVNGDFETENAGEWTVTNDTILFLSTAGENPRNGSKGCVTFNTYSVEDLTADENGCYAAILSQTIKDLPAGVYEARTYFEGLDGAGKNTGEYLNISAIYGDTTQTSDNATLYGWMVWQAAVVSDIVITDEMVEAGTNSVTLYANVSLLGETWGSIDDFYLYRTGDVVDDEDDTTDDDTTGDDTTNDDTTNDDTTNDDTTNDDTTNDDVTNDDTTEDDVTGGDIIGSGDQEDEISPNPSAGEDNNNETEDQGSESDEGIPTGGTEDVDKIIEQIKATEAGKTTTLTVGKDGMTTVLTKEMLQTAKAEKVNLVIDMGEYTWTIKADSIKSAKDVNLEVILDTKGIPTDKINALGNDISYRQLSLKYDGEFDFTATLTVNVGSEHKGKYGNLYYYNDKKELEFVDSAIIGTNGNISLELTHASDYVIVIGENMATDDTDTGDHAPILPFVLVMLAGCAMVVGVVARRKSAR